jgi:hypothetical protein
MKNLLQVLSSAIIVAFALVPYAGPAPSSGPEGPEALVSGDSTPAPAPACGKCGDGYCAKQCGETAQSCPKDCGWAL